MYVRINRIQCVWNWTEVGGMQFPSWTDNIMLPLRSKLMKSTNYWLQLTSMRPYFQNMENFCELPAPNFVWLEHRAASCRFMQIEFAQIPEDFNNGAILYFLKYKLPVSNLSYRSWILYYKSRWSRSELQNGFERFLSVTCGLIIWCWRDKA